MENPYASPTSGILGEADASSDAGLPPIGIKHFLIWLGFFVLLQLFAFWIESTAQEESVSWGSRIWSVVELARGAAVLMGGVVLFTSRKARGAVLQHSGHWLILFSCLTDLYSWGVGYWYVLSLDRGSNPSHFGSLGNLFFAVFFFVLVCAAAWTSGVWRWLFAAMAIRPFVFGLARQTFSRQAFSAFRANFGFLSSVLDASVVVFAVCEAVTGMKRDWVHWLGVAAFAVGASFPLWFWLFGV